MKRIKISSLYYILLLYSCSSYNYQNIAGSYIFAPPNDYHALHQNLVLYADGSFVYSVKSSMFSDTVLGKWRLQKSNLYFVTEHEKSFYLILPCDTCEVNRISVFDKKTKDKMEHAHIQIYNNSLLKEEFFTDNNGVATFVQNSFDSIRINYVGYESVSIGYYKSVSNIDVFLVKRNNSIMSPNKWKLISDKKIKQVGGHTFIKHSTTNSPTPP